MGSKEREENRSIIIPLWLLAACSLEFLQMQTSLLAVDMPIPVLSLPRFLLNLSLILFVHFLLRLVCRRWSVSFYLSAAFFFLWAAADYYTICYHGSPLFFSELGNVQAALAVSGSYKMHFHWIPGLNLLIFGIEMITSYFLCRFFASRNRKPLLFASLSTVSLLVFVIGFHLLHVLVNDYILGWKWYDNVRDYGFICCTAEDFCNTLFPYTSGDPFKNNPILALEKDYRNVSARKEEDAAPFPDIILIVNESFYDLAVHSNLQTDQDYLKDYYSIEGALYGFAECPNIGGRTNDSEYELLTGCSMDRLRASAPFNYLDLTRGPSVVRFLKKLGYETTAMHCGQPKIYSRDTGYRQLGFDHVILGQEHFPHHSQNGNREWLDEDNYKDLIASYEGQGTGPRFFYLMTYQNHGSYDQNDSSQDTVHPVSNDIQSQDTVRPVSNDIQSQDTVHPTALDAQTRDETAEYLSSILLSARAIHRFTDYFAHRARPVVVCMIGDHAPPLINQLPPKNKDRETGLREVPFMIWNNAGIDFSTRHSVQSSNPSSHVGHPSAQPSDQEIPEAQPSDQDIPEVQSSDQEIPEAQSSDQDIPSMQPVPLAYPANQTKAFRDRMGWKDQGLDMTEIMAELIRCLLRPVTQVSGGPSPDAP